MAVGSKSARDKLRKTGGSSARATGPWGSLSARQKLIAATKKKTAKKTGTNVLKKTASKPAYAKLIKTSNRAGAIKKLKQTGGGAAKSTKNLNPRSKGQGAGSKYTTKAYQEYLKKMKKGQKKSNLQRKNK